jgi:epoxyqueuosine reductase QueG
MKKSITEEIQKYICNYSEKNDVGNFWRTPLVGYAYANDSLFEELKSVVSPSHAHPKDLLPKAKTVIAFFIPFIKEIPKSNIKEKYCSDLWAESYIATNLLIKDLSIHLDKFLFEQGHQSKVIPATHNFDEEKLISDWSHRHIAYIAGLGTFGMNNMLITAEGCGGRLGSLITTAEISPSSRPDHEYCLYKFDQSCKRCIERCVNHAFADMQFDRFRCYEMCLHNDERLKKFGTTDVCGKCLVGVPCTFTDPTKKRLHT